MPLMAQTIEKDYPPKILKKKLSFRRKILRFVERSLAILGVFFLIYHLGFSLSMITTESMAPTLLHEDWILTEKVSYWFRQPNRFEVVSYQNTEGLQIMKRVMALPKEEISLNKEGWVLINGKSIPQPLSLKKLKYFPYGNLKNGKVVSYDYGFYVLGDHTRDSQDSRFEGFLDPKKITGRAWFRVWPLSRLGFITP